MQPSDIHWQNEIAKLKEELKGATKEQKEAIKKTIAEYESYLTKPAEPVNETPLSVDEN